MKKAERRTANYRQTKTTLNAIGLEGIDLMQPPESFTVQLDHATKEAVRAIAAAAPIYTREGELLSGWGGSTMGECFASLIRDGLAALSPVLEAEIAAVQADRQPWIELSEFLFAHPEMSTIWAKHMPEGSAARALLLDTDDEDSGGEGWPATAEHVQMEVFSLNGRLARLIAAQQAVRATLKDSEAEAPE